jgi:hypothetical protein
LQREKRERGKERKEGGRWRREGRGGRRRGHEGPGKWWGNQHTTLRVRGRAGADQSPPTPSPQISFLFPCDRAGTEYLFRSGLSAASIQSNHGKRELIFLRQVCARSGVSSLWTSARRCSRRGFIVWMDGVGDRAYGGRRRVGAPTATATGNLILISSSSSSPGPTDGWDARSFSARIWIWIWIFPDELIYRLVGSSGHAASECSFQIISFPLEDYTMW